MLLGAYCIGPFITSWTLHDYFLKRDVWMALLAGATQTQLDIHGHYLRLLYPIIPFTLPGVFQDFPIISFYGSVWTIPLEVRCYVAIAILGATGFLNARVMLGLFLASALMYSQTSPNTIQVIMRDYTLFLFGSLLYFMSSRITFNRNFFLTALVLFIPSYWMPSNLGYLLHVCFFCSAVIGFGFLKLPLIDNFGKYGDFSYGFYLYAWPLQQLCLLWFGSHGHFLPFMATSFALALLCAVISWHIIEKPALAHKS